MSDPVEIEVKFLVENPVSLRGEVAALGALSHGRGLEINYRYDDPEASLAQRRMLLRLRRDRSIKLTVKTPPAAEDPQFKVLREIEVEVSDFETMDRLLSRLGFQRVQIYEKWRETFRLGDTLLCIDELPYGTFLEIEGSKPSIRQLAQRLGFPWSGRILANYLEIFDAVRSALGLIETDLTFRAFENIPQCPAAIIRRFEADDSPPVPQA
jgi:adenylate cyclase class 2